jgi:catalase
MSTPPPPLTHANGAPVVGNTHSQTAGPRGPRSKLRSAQNNWDFWTLLPEALHQVTCVMDDRGLPDGYQPNSRGAWADQPGLMEPPLPLQGGATQGDHRADDDHFSQPGDLFRPVAPAEQQRHIEHCTRADPACGRAVAPALESLGRSPG